MIDFVVDVREIPFDLLSVTWSSGRHATMDAVELAISWLQMSNDAFYECYGFNYVPSARIKKLARKRIN